MRRFTNPAGDPAFISVFRIQDELLALNPADILDRFGSHLHML